MTPLIDADGMLAILERGRHVAYGPEKVTQLEHSVQCAALAQQAGQGAHQIVACLLHDLGHLLNENDGEAYLRGEDGRHEAIGAAFAARFLPPAVAEPIRLHVAAKRYLTCVDPAYLRGLSPVSVRSLTLQGGPFSPAQAEAFARLPFAREALALRRFDDAAKRQDFPLLPPERFRPYLQACLDERAPGSHGE